MYTVRNQKVVRRLSYRSFLANRMRNLVAILAIILTTILFTTLFTVVISFNYTSQQQTMRMVGGYAHGGFKYITMEQVEQLANHSSIDSYGYSTLLAIPEDAPFNKRQVELRYGTKKAAKMYFCEPTTGRMPEKVEEIAMDTTVLSLLGIPCKLGEKVTLSYQLGDKTYEDSFTLVGFWDCDSVAQASEVWLAKDYVLEKLNGYEIGKYSNLYGTWNLDILFSNSNNIEQKLRKVAEDSGYTIDDENADNYLSYGVNWAYTSTHYENGEKTKLILGLVIGIVFIAFAGYLIIYNIFGISVMNDLHFYGLLKTIGTTKRQIKRIIRYQGILLSVIGIPIGLLLGFLLGGVFVKIIVESISSNTASITFNAWIFIGAAVFALITVLLSCSKPGRLAAKVSPIEAVRYTEGNKGNRLNKGIKKGRRGARIYRMALGNVGRSKGKTTLVILSMTLSIVLFNTLYSFTQSFSMDQFLSKFTISDYMLGSANYFQSSYRGNEDNVSETFIEAAEAQGITEQSGRVYTYNGIVEAPVTKERLKAYMMQWEANNMLESIDAAYPDQEEFTYGINLFGLDAYPLSKLQLIEGKKPTEVDKKEHPIIQIVSTNDYGQPNTDSMLYDIGDKVKLHYVDEFAWDEELDEMEELESHDVEYIVVATMMMPNVMSTRSFGYPQFALLTDAYLEDTKQEDTMLYMMDVTDDQLGKMDQFVKDYTKRIESSMDYESRKLMEEEFSGFKNMFLLVGGGITIVIALIGILNFINTIVTSIQARKHEFAVLQSIGMTGKQLKKMVIMEGLLYILIAVISAILVGSIINISILRSLESLLWFYDYSYNITAILMSMPVLLFVGAGIPILAYRKLAVNSLVERMRTVE
ncbi:ABC transporter permease [Anaerosporobacter faecicola]|uniref:ABC transporter permease n=1 Tax=Anaerosporobacter faecicola TaxID=2718714 RepID=UPI0014395A56|nr:ABC transporter permease [Anaerosporobacter faecicola]